jgi:predicted nucleic acid-binding protein
LDTNIVVSALLNPDGLEVTGNPKHFPAKVGKTLVIRTRAILATLQP